MKNSEELITAIDTDEGLKSKRKLLTIASLTLLALSFSGAKIEEANSFIFKIKFAHQNGLAILLVISIIFLMVRYYNYAKKYHDRLYSIWTNRLLTRGFFYSPSPETPHDDGGILAFSRCSELDAQIGHDVTQWESTYECGWLFTRYIKNSWGYNAHPEKDWVDRVDRVNIFKSIGIKAYFKSISYEAIEQFKSFFTHRENLDILAPYFIGCAAIASYYFNADLQEVLNSISISTKK
jgi:hypothetical protein